MSDVKYVKPEIITIDVDGIAVMCACAAADDSHGEMANNEKLQRRMNIHSSL